MIERLVEGWTLPLEFQLLKNGVPFTSDELQGIDVSLVLRDKSGTVVDTTNKCAWKAGVDSVVVVSLGEGDLVAANSPYTAHFELTDVSDKILFIPKGEPDRWIVSKK
jgi:hypothetical protein